MHMIVLGQVKVVCYTILVLWFLSIKIVIHSFVF